MTHDIKWLRSFIHYGERRYKEKAEEGERRYKE